MIDSLARKISFFAPAAVMSAWGTVMLRTVVAGHINRLLSPMFRDYVLVAAVVSSLILSALHVLLYLYRRPTPLRNWRPPAACDKAAAVAGWCFSCRSSPPRVLSPAALSDTYQPRSMRA